MTERPILFQGAMVRAILDGSKTQTRRVAKPAPEASGALLRPCPYGVPGDRLWVRETWAQNENQLSDIYMDTSLVYRADGGPRALDNGTEKPWRPAIHMPRWACRLVLEVVAVRVERLQAISDADALAEGVKRCTANIEAVRDGLVNRSMHCDRYARLWDSINPADAMCWRSNPWVWVVEFRRVP